MLPDADKQILIDGFNKLGEAAVEAKLVGGFCTPLDALVAREWLSARRVERENAQRKEDLKYIRLTAQSSLALAVVTIILVGVTLYGILGQTTDNKEQRNLVKELLEQQKANSEAQSTDAHLLMEVQISVELDKQFDSTEMRNSRRRLATQLLNHKEVTEFRLLDFFEKAALFEDQKRLDQDTISNLYSYWIARYWPALKSTVKELREMENDPSYYKGFEELNDEMLADDAKDGLVAPPPKEILRFLREEASLPR